jgi:hypothetical protein
MENDSTLRRSGEGIGNRSKGGAPTQAGLADRSWLMPVSALALVLGLLGLIVAAAGVARASTYVVYVALDDPVYEELETLNGAGLLDDYLTEIKPIARVEAARLTLEAERNLDDSEQPDPLSHSIIESLREEFSEEVEWLEDGHEDNPPTMIHPLERIEAQYVYSGGSRRLFALFPASFREFQAQEGTPLLPNNDGLPTSIGSNEILRASSWAGVGGFMTAYAETAVAGPVTSSPLLYQQSWPYGGMYHGSPAVTQVSDTDRLRLMRGGLVASIGNQALAFGYQEVSWGTGHFGALSQGNNSRPFPALIFQNVHPRPLPWILRYLGPFRHQIFVGELDHGRYAENFNTTPAVIANYPYPWISGQVIAFKPLPIFEFGLDHVIMFGGTNNSNYGWTGWIGRATGLSTGNPAGGNTNARAGAFLKLYLPSLRNTQIYQEMLAEDNAGILPIKAVSFQGGVYIPRVTADGMTDARFEYALLESNYSTHGDSLYWAYYGQLMGDPMGPDASEVDLSVGRWFAAEYKADVDVFYTERAPHFSVAYLSKERSGGFALDVLRIPGDFKVQNFSLFGSLKVRAAVEYVHDLNWMPGTSSMRTMVLISGSLWPNRYSWIWH